MYEEEMSHLIIWNRMKKYMLYIIIAKLYIISVISYYNKRF